MPSGSVGRSLVGCYSPFFLVSKFYFKRRRRRRRLNHSIYENGRRDCDIINLYSIQLNRLLDRRKSILVSLSPTTTTTKKEGGRKRANSKRERVVLRDITSIREQRTTLVGSISSNQKCIKDGCLRVAHYKS